MNWSSVKSLLIAILIAANLFLLHNVASQRRTGGFIPENEIEGAVALLSERGLFISSGAIPREKFQAPVYESRYSDEYYTLVTERLTGSKREILISLPDGGFSITAENGGLAEFDTEFGFFYSKYNNSTMNAYTGITAEDFYKEDDYRKELSASKLKTLSDIALDFLITKEGTAEAPSAEIVSGYYNQRSRLSFLLARQTIGGCQVYSHYAVCVFNGEELIGAVGRWYFLPFDKEHSASLVDQVNILFADLAVLKEGSAVPIAAAEGEEPVSTAPVSETVIIPGVSSMSPCYIVYWNADKTALFFIPAWQVDHTDTQTIVYNATNSTVYSRNR